MKRFRGCTVALLAGTLLAGGCRPRTADRPNGAAAAIKVRAAPPAERAFRDIVRIQGALAAKNRATIAALAPGTLDAVFVDAGARVRKGQELFQTDKVNLEARVAMEQHNARVADAAIAEARAGLRQAEAALEKAALDHARFKQLYERDRAVTLDAWEKADAGFKQAEAGRDHARALLDLALARRDQAAAALRIAEKQLADSLARAPFDAVVRARLLEPGEYAAAGAAVLSLADEAALEARGHVAAAAFGRVAPGATRAEVRAGGRLLGEFPVTLRSPTVDAATRTFEVRVALADAAGLADGMACELALVLDRREGLGVPSAAVVVRDGQPGVFVAANGQARLVGVTRGIVDDGFTELAGAEALRGQAVVVEGQTFLNDGSAVRTD